MPTTVITGRNVTLTIDSDNFDAQATSAVLTVVADRQVYETLDGKAYKTIENNSTLQVEMLSDWGATNSLCESLWTAASTAPDTALAFTFVSATGASWAGTLYPEFPDAGGSGKDAQTVSVTFTVVGTPVLTIS